MGRIIKDKLERFLFGGNRFKQEFKRQLRWLIIVTLAVTIAFSWRQTVLDLVQKIVKAIFNVQGDTYLSILTSVFITVVGLILIFITSQILKEKPDN